MFTTCMPDEVMTDMYYPIYPDGLYNAIKRWGKGGVWARGLSWTVGLATEGKAHARVHACVQAVWTQTTSDAGREVCRGHTQRTCNGSHAEMRR